MPRSRFVTPSTRILPLSGGDSITVRDRLTHGETADGFQWMTYLDKDDRDNPLRTDPRKARDALVLTYLVDWTFTGPDGTVVPIRGIPRDELATILSNLDPLDFAEVYDAVAVHDRGVRQRLIEQKKTAAENAPALT